MVAYGNGQEKQCHFKHEEDVDRFLAYIEEAYPDIPVHSVEAERKLAEKRTKACGKTAEVNVTAETKKVS